MLGHDCGRRTQEDGYQEPDPEMCLRPLGRVRCAVVVVPGLANRDMRMYPHHIRLPHMHDLYANLIVFNSFITTSGEVHARQYGRPNHIRKRGRTPGKDRALFDGPGRPIRQLGALVS